MKRIYIMLSVTVLVLIAGVSAQPLLHVVLERQIKKSLGADRVSIKSLTWHPQDFLQLNDIVVQRAGAFEATVRVVTVRYNPAALLRKRLISISMQGISVTLDQAKAVKETTAWPKGDAALPFHVEDVMVSEVNIRSKAAGPIVQNASLTLHQLEKGSLSVETIRWNKLPVTDIRAGIVMNHGNLTLDQISADVLKGRVRGVLDVRLSKVPEFNGRFTMTGLDMVNFVETFELKDKLQADDKMSGNMTFAGKGLALKALNGSLSTGTGGVLTLMDTRILKNIAKYARQPEEFVVASLKNYHYNTGGIGLWMEEDGLVLLVKLRGESGKRDIQIKLHNLIKK